MPRYITKYSVALKFANPYTFIPLGSACTRNEQDNPDTITGWIEYTIDPITPLFIPNTSQHYIKSINGKENKSYDLKSYDFFSYDNLSPTAAQKTTDPSQPVIPGSEIRGCIRSVHEALTNSCLSTLDTNRNYYRRNAAPFPSKGILSYNEESKKFILKKCVKYLVDIDLCNNLEEGQKVYISDIQNATSQRIQLIFKQANSISTTNSNSNNNSNSNKMGFLHKSEPFILGRVGQENRKNHYYSVFVEVESPDIELDRSSIENYFTNLDLYRDDKINLHTKKPVNRNELQHKKYKFLTVKNNEDLESGKIALVYYRVINGTNYLFSPSAIGREVFSNDKIAGDYTPCADDNLCPACRLFGSLSVASRVRFTDAHYISETNTQYDYDNFSILKELASPKPFSSEFYVEKPTENQEQWTYNYKADWKKQSAKNEYGGQLNNPTNKILSTIEYQGKIRGRKFYWHHNPDSLKPYTNSNEATDRNVMVRPLKARGQFTGKIFFDGITQAELKNLIASVSFNNKTEYGHKIGMGKPYGLGSIQIQINKVYTRSFADGKRKVEEENLNNLIDKMDFPKVFLLSPSLNARIEYPNNVDSKDIFEWFVSNKQVADGENEKKGTAFNPIIEQILPNINDNDQTLKKYRKEEVQHNNYQGGNNRNNQGAGRNQQNHNNNRQGGRR